MRANFRPTSHGYALACRSTPGQKKCFARMRRKPGGGARSLAILSPMAIPGRLVYTSANRTHINIQRFHGQTHDHFAATPAGRLPTWSVTYPSTPILNNDTIVT